MHADRAARTRFALLLMLISGLLIVVLLRQNQPPPAQIAPVWAVPPLPPELEGMPVDPSLAELEPAGTIQHGLLDVAVAPQVYAAEQHAPLAADLAQALAYVAERTGMQPASRMQVAVIHRDNCALSGLAFTDQRVLQVFGCERTPPQRIVNIAAHEFVHQLAYDRYGAAHTQGDLAIREGLATWGSGRYWLGGQASYRAFVRQFYAGNLLPLDAHYRGRSIDEMNQLYYQWASFVEFLLETRGREAFDALAVTGNGAPGSGDYSGMYGVPLEGLEQEWQAWVTQ